MDKARLFWVGFNLVKGIGAVRFRSLLETFGSAEQAWNASASDLRQAGLGPKLVENLTQVRSQVSLEQVWQRIQAQGIQVLTWEDEAYPRRLKEIDQPPPVLYLRGDLQAQDEWAVAVVGTRQVSAYGRQVTEELAGLLARNGVTVVSGLARGVDSVAHQAALNAGGRTLAILGCGVDRIYPPENRRLAEQLLAHGALMSDYAPGTPPDGPNFPPRNRIISGLSMAVVVIEAGLTSGALITASFAADQGREVFAVPGNILAPQSKGTNRLIRDGARPLLEPQEVLEALNLTRVVEHRTARTALPGDATEALLLQTLTHEPLHVDEIRTLTSLPIEKVSASLALMELKGMVRQVGGMNYVRAAEAAETYEVDE
ncbi:MAG TPA: DNA-processing protein DprA [Anaerolineales bacterium]|nr:DNA-processing protein DprA [Anaerolineales bacterium]